MSCGQFNCTMERSPSGEKALKALENGGKKSVDCQSLLQNAFNTFSFLERWETAESNVPSVMSIIERVRHQGHAYFETLDDSISIAITLIELAHDAEHLASSLLDPSHKPRDIQDFVGDMQNYVRDALEKSKGVSSALRSIRKGVNEITNNIPREMAKLERKEQRLVAKKEALERRIGHARVAKTLSAAALAVVSGVATVAFPPVLLILPVALPIAILALQAYGHHSSKALMKRQDEIWDCRAGLAELQDITMCLARLAEHVDSMTEFWVRSDTMLETISNGVHRIKGNAARLRLQTTVSHWKSAAESYTEYATKLKMIRQFDCVATASLKSRVSSSDGSRGSDKGAHGSRDQRKSTSTDLKRRNASRSSSKGSSSSPSSSPRRSSHKTLES
ncbi:hypothetical protein C8R44DRAFT_206491 [Mycena epipterygia]|nr:hypothetical protein C8R44DRAFT_206491 [Mycena epipterygia]